MPMHYYMWLEDMASDSTDNSANIDGHIAYHKEMEHIANRAGDFTKAGHHRKMQEIYKAIKEKVQGEDWLFIRQYTSPKKYLIAFAKDHPWWNRSENS